MISILRIRDHESIRRCYPVMAQLRLHLDESAFCEQVERRESHTLLKNAQIPFPTWSADGKKLTLTGKKFDTRQFSHGSSFIFAFPRSRPSWFVLS